MTAALLQETALITMPPAAGPTRMLEHWLAVNNLEAEYTFQWRRDDTRPLLAHMREAVAQTVDFTKPNPLW